MLWDHLGIAEAGEQLGARDAVELLQLGGQGHGVAATLAAAAAGDERTFPSKLIAAR
jgi:hypothetical protein